MKYYSYSDTSTCAEISEFSSLGGVNEFHLMIHATNAMQTYEEQLEEILNTYHNLVLKKCIGAKAIFRRFFLSDIANQANILSDKIKEDSAFACSIIEQPPLNGTKIAMWVYMQTNIVDIKVMSGMMTVRNKKYTHLWQGSSFCCGDNSENQTDVLLSDYIDKLSLFNCFLKDNCIRTWFFVQNVDVNYTGLVKARNKIFTQQGLTENTHYIASTGIGGRHSDPSVLVQMDTYAIAGIDPNQIQYLYAPTHLNPTYEYGVSFERGTCVKFGDRRQVFISGTASIDNKGQVVWQGDIRKQTLRMLENVAELLNEAECSFDDIAQAIIYLRDVSDYSLVKDIFDNYAFPKVIVLAPVCRVNWLIEMECIAIKADINNEFQSY